MREAWINKMIMLVPTAGSTIFRVMVVHISHAGVTVKDEKGNEVFWPYTSIHSSWLDSKADA